MDQRTLLEDQYKNPNWSAIGEMNKDFTGSRTLHGTQEYVAFRENSFVRTWFNTQTDSYDTHWHGAIEIILPLENNYNVTIQDQLFKVQPGEILLIPPRALHSIEAPESGNRLIYLFELESLSKLTNFAGISSLLTKPVYLTHKTACHQQVYELLTKIQDEYFSKHEYSELSIYSYLIQLMVTLGYDHINQPDLFPNVREQKQKEYIHKFNQLISYIDEHLTESIDIDYIAESTGFSKYHFLRLFKQYTGNTFADYINLRKLKKSEELLEKSLLSVGEVSTASGFSSISTFNRIFKQYKGCSPTEYRSIHHRPSRDEMN